MESCVRGCHIYQELWEAVIGEELQCQRERDNPADMYAVVVRKNEQQSFTFLEDLHAFVHCLSEEEDPYTCSPTRKRSNSNVRTVIVHC